MLQSLLLFIGCLYAQVSKAQALQYLNASQGNRDEFVVDKDTNMYMFHCNQLEKYNKHMQPIWVKRYDSLVFNNLLLTKTNALYFIASPNCTDYSNLGNQVGKLDTAGNIIWCKETNLGFGNLRMTYDNNLLFTHGQGILKMDTLGSVIYCKNFSFSTNPSTVYVSSLITDSMGVYKIIGGSVGISFRSIYIFKYSEIVDSVIDLKYRPNSAGLQNADILSVLVSKFYPQTYYLYCLEDFGNGGATKRTCFEKIIGNSIVYRINTPFTGSAYSLLNNITEDEKGFAYFSESRRVDEGLSVYAWGYHNIVYKMDTIANNLVMTGNRLINDVWTGTPPVYVGYEKGKFHYFYKNHFILDYVGKGYSLNMPSIKQIDSTIKTSCSSFFNPSNNPTTSSLIQSGLGYPYFKTINNTSYNLTPKMINVTAVTNFSVDTNYCLTISYPELNLKENGINVFPNPSNSMLTISTNEEIQGIKLYNNLGAEMNVKLIGSKSIDVSVMPNSVYFIEVKTNNGIIRKKFVKE